MFLAADVAKVANANGEFATETGRHRAATLREFLFPKIPDKSAITGVGISKRLRRHVGASGHDGAVLTLREIRDPHTKMMKFYVETKLTAGL
jgi:hypothetical protein